MTTIHKSVYYPHAPADVWVALTDPHALAEWLFPNDFQPVVGHRFVIQADPVPLNKLIRCDCRVVELAAPSRMVWDWTAVMRGGRDVPMRLTWTLTPEGAGTRLTLEHTGVEGHSLFMRVLTRLGWGTMLGKPLRTVLGHIRDGRFTPGAVPMNKRYYKAKTIPAHLVR